MKQNCFFLTIILLLAMGCKNEREPSSSPDLEVYIDSLFQASVDSAEIVGGSFLVFQKDKTILKKSYGYASLELTSPMPDDAIFEIGSVTKQFTSTAILKLVESEKLSLDDDFTKYLEFDTKGRTITINQLLNHTSGIPSYTEMPDFWKLSIQDLPRDSLVRLVEQNDFLFEPGEALIYNNSAYFFLGLIIEQVTGQTYEEFLNEVIFEPLGMNNTHYCSTSKVVKNKVYGYNYSPDGLTQKPYLNHTWPYAAGSLCSTTEDLLIWMRALHDQKILPEALYQSIISPDPLKDGTEVGYAKGLANFSNYGRHEISHGGGINGFLSDTRYYPDEDLYIICLVNTTGPKGAGYFANEITWKLLEKIEHKGIDLDINTKSLEGSYTGAVRGTTHSLEIKSIEEGLTVQAVGDDNLDTLNVYVGNNTWMSGNNKITIQNDEYRTDQIYGYYILKKDEE